MFAHLMLRMFASLPTGIVSEFHNIIVLVGNLKHFSRHVFQHD